MSSKEEEPEKDYYQEEERKKEEIIKKYNVGTLQIFLTPEILSMEKKERKKIAKIYYKREYTTTPSELQKSQKEYENLQKQIQQPPQPTLQVQGQGQPPQPPQQLPPQLPMQLQPPPPQPPPPPPPQQLIKRPIAGMKGGNMQGAGLFDSDGSSFDEDRNRRMRMEQAVGQPIGQGVGQGIRGDTGNVGTTTLANRLSLDSEPFIASLVKFNNSGFPNNSTIKNKVDTFFNISLFKAYLKRLGEPIKLYGPNNVIVDPDSINILKPDISKPVVDKDNIYLNDNPSDDEKKGEYITNWFPLQQQQQKNLPLIGAIYSFIYIKPTEQENKQQAELNKKVSRPSTLMVKQGDNYSLIGGIINNKKRIVTAIAPSSTSSSSYSDECNSETSSQKVDETINTYYKTITGQSSLPQAAVSSSAKKFIYIPKNVGKGPNIVKDDTGKVLTSKCPPTESLPTVVYSRQVSKNQIDSIIESSKTMSNELVTVPIVDLYNIISGKVKNTAILAKFEIDDNTKKILLFLFRILEKQNLLSTIVGQQVKKKEEFYDDKQRIEDLKQQLSPASFEELDSVIKHNINFILNIIFSNKNAFKYLSIDYIIDYIEWNKIFKQLKKVLLSYKVAYYIELTLFLEKLEKGKLPIDRDATLMSSCAVRGAQLNRLWTKKFLEQNWTKVGKQIASSFKTTPKLPSVSDILPGFIKNALQLDSTQLMSSLNPGVNQISFVQYCFLGQEQLIEEIFKNVDNSFAGVSWKNENSWEKRKERLFAAMDICDADIYCFQNVQCSLKVYRQIIEELKKGMADDEAKQSKLDDLLEDIGTNKLQTERVDKYTKDILPKLLQSITDPTNSVAQIYAKYQNAYEFVYFFEQDVNSDTLSPAYSKNIAVGHLTMVKKNKFTVIHQFDIRMGNVINKNKKAFGDITVFDPVFNNTSFATVTYILFKGGEHLAGNSKPGVAPSVVKNPAPASTSVSTQEIKLPGADEKKEFDEAVKQADKTDTIPEENNAADKVEDTFQDENDEATEVVPGQRGGGNDNDANVEWYNRSDANKSESSILGLFNRGKPDTTSVSNKSKPNEDTCTTKYTNPSYIPMLQKIGIINIKLDTAKTVNNINTKLSASVPQVKKGDKPTTIKKVTKQMIEVLLISAFFEKFRSRYYLSGSTDDNPIFIGGDFNFDISSDLGKGNIKNIYASAPALQLLLARSNSGIIDKFNKYSSLMEYGDIITNFIRSVKILTYLYGGEGKNGRFGLTGYSKLNHPYDQMFGNTYRGSDNKTVNKSQFIFLVI